MGPVLFFVVVFIFVVGVVAAYILGSLRQTVETPKAFGLHAFETHDLGHASGDVLKAVVATISFLGHQFTVIQEAEEARATASARSARTRAKIGENLDDIAGLIGDNQKLTASAVETDARASMLDTLIAQVGSVVGN